MNNILQELSASLTNEVSRFTTVRTHDILYVEDDEDLRGLFAEILLKSGYRVEVADDGQSGWDALQLGSYDLLITDIEMPRLTGLELVKRLRTAGQTLPVVVVSGSFGAEEQQQHRWLRVAATLMKPFTPDQLLETVQEVLRAASGVRKRASCFFPYWPKPSPKFTPLHTGA